MENEKLNISPSNHDRFIDNGDGTVTDTEKGLMWNKTDSMNDLKKWRLRQGTERKKIRRL